MKSLSVALIFLLSVIGCKPESPKTTHPPEGGSTTDSTEKRSFAIAGEIFLTLKSRETLKMSLVNVHLITENTAEKLLNKYAAFKAKILAMEKDRNSLINKIQQIKSHPNVKEERSASEAVKAWKAESERLTQLDRLYHQPSIHKQREEALELWVSSQDRWSHATDAAEAITKQLPELEESEAKVSEELQKAKNIDVIFGDGLYPDVANTLTDSDGRFSFIIPTREKLYLLAKTTRETGSKKQDLLWMVPLAQDGKNILANHNLLSE